MCVCVCVLADATTTAATTGTTGTMMTGIVTRFRFHILWHLWQRSELRVRVCSRDDRRRDDYDRRDDRRY